MLALRDAMGAAYKYEYNMGLVKSIDPLGRITKYQRDAESRITVLTDPMGRNTSFTYDLSGNVTEVRNPADFVTKFAYGNGACPSCGGSQLSALTDPKGNTWTFGYDQYGRLTNTTNPLGEAKTYNYDKMSRVTEVKDPAGNITSYTYDALNRLTKKDIHTTAGIHSITDYTYDAVGNLLNIANGESAVSYTYDALNRVVGTGQTFGGKTYTINYSYDAVGNRTLMSTPWGKYSYAYDALSRLSTITNPQGIVITFKYDAAGRRIEKNIFSSSAQPLTSTTYIYNVAGHLLSINNKGVGKTVAFANYEYDSNGNRVKMEDQNGVHTYKYDAASRLIVARDLPLVPFRGEGFAYDKAGNRRHDTMAKDYKYDAANRLQESSLYTYTHDLNGNLTSRTEKASSATITYDYTPEQQLAEVVTPENKVQYKYDPLGRRIETAVNMDLARYLYDGQNIIADIDSTGDQINTYTNGLGIDEPLIMSKSVGKSYYYHADAIGSITALSDDSGLTIESYQYKAYGTPIINNSAGSVIDASKLGNTRMFTAREYDFRTGLYNNRTRYQDPTRGAFTQEDLIGFEGGLNLYTYGANNSLNYADPFGTDIWLEGPSVSEPAGHLSLSVGDVGGKYLSFSFGVDQSLPGFLMASTYQDVKPGGLIYKDYYMKSTPQQDKDAISYILNHQFKRPYRSLYLCRTYAIDTFIELHENGFGTPAKRPALMWNSLPQNPSSEVPLQYKVLRGIGMLVYLSDLVGATK